MTYKKYNVEVDTNGDKFWYKNGELHREDGPAVEYYDGTKKWYLNGFNYTEEEFLKKISPVKELTVAEIEKLLGIENYVAGRD
jgi:hypothetical protein